MSTHKGIGFFSGARLGAFKSVRGGPVTSERSLDRVLQFAHHDMGLFHISENGIVEIRMPMEHPRAVAVVLNDSSSESMVIATLDWLHGSVSCSAKLLVVNDPLKVPGVLIEYASQRDVHVVAGPTLNADSWPEGTALCPATE